MANFPDGTNEEVSVEDFAEECIVFDLDKDVYRRESCQGNHSVICAASGNLYNYLIITFLKKNEQFQICTKL